MHRIVTTIATGLAVAAGCFGATMALGGAQASDGLAALLNGEPACQAVPADAPGTRILDWDGSDHVTPAVPGEAVWQPGGDGKLHVSGDPQVVAHLRVRDGVIESDCSQGLFFQARETRLRITLPGRAFRHVHVAGSGTLVMHGLNQQALEASISGSGDIKADGKVAEEDIHISGSGDADFAGVDSVAAALRISGSGDVDVTATHAANIRISGSGDVTLRGNPPLVTQRVSGSGAVRRADT